MTVSGGGCGGAIPKTAIYITITVLLLSIGVSIFILVLVHNSLFFIIYLFLSAFVISFITWNSLSYRRNIALSVFVASFPYTDIRIARHGQLVKISGPVSCGSVALQSSYEKVERCVYTSTVLYESRGFDFKGCYVKLPCFPWRLTYLERFSADFYISDTNSGIRTLVKAGYGSKVISVIPESRLVTTSKHRTLSPNLTKWLKERDLSAEYHPICLEEGCIQEGNSITVMGILHKGGDDDIPMVVQPPDLISTGCLWQRLLLPIDFDGLILGMTDVSDSSNRRWWRKVSATERLLLRKFYSQCYRFSSNNLKTNLLLDFKDRPRLGFKFKNLKTNLVWAFKFHPGLIMEGLCYSFGLQF